MIVVITIIFALSLVTIRLNSLKYHLPYDALSYVLVYEDPHASETVQKDQ